MQERSVKLGHGVKGEDKKKATRKLREKEESSTQGGQQEDQQGPTTDPALRHPPAPGYHLCAHRE
jgi:hypothetical protein